MPNHELNLKAGVPVMLIRNIDHALGLCNGTKLVITKLGCYVLEVKMLSGGNASDNFYPTYVINSFRCDHLLNFREYNFH